MADKVYQLPYDDEIDKDIHDWLNTLPRSRKAEMVRNAIRYYLQATQGSINSIVAIPPQVPTSEDSPKKGRKKPSLPKDGGL